MNFFCSHARVLFEEVRALNFKFSKKLANAKQGDVPELLDLKKQLEKDINFIRQYLLKELLSPFDSLHLEQQYTSQLHILRNTSIIETLSNGQEGITGIDNKEYPIPTIYEIAKRLRNKQEIIKTKESQGFTKFLIIPFGMSLDTLIDKYKTTILKHHQENKLLATKENPQDQDEHLELDENQPIYILDQYQNADKNNNLVYYPTSFTPNHQGHTKQQILTQEQQGFHLLFIEPLPNIPREGKGQTIGNRKQLETNQTPKDYLKILQTTNKRKNQPYQHEQGMTPEVQLIYNITHLEETNQVTDDYQGKGSASYQIGTYFTSSGFVPDSSWNRNFRRAGLSRVSPGFRSENFGARAVVRV